MMIAPRRGLGGDDNHRVKAQSHLTNPKAPGKRSKAMKPLLHFLLGAVAVAGDDVEFQRLVLFILHAQRLAFIVDKFHL
jgi:hypothetical protein